MDVGHTVPNHITSLRSSILPLFLFFCNESVGNLKKLKYLEFLQCLYLEKLPDAICKLTSLQTLLLNQFPRLVSLPRRLGELQSLEELGLEDLAITDTPYSIGQLKKLHKLYLKKLDRLRSLPDSISALNCLERFDIEGTNLKGTKIDGVDFMNMNQLEISICSCFTVLPTSSLRKARALYVTDGTVEELPESIRPMENITKFSLRCKNLKALPDWLPHWKNLKIFEVDCECLTLKMINIIRSLTSVESLSLHCANLDEMPAVARSFAENLKSFTLGCKNLKELPEWIGSLTSLRYLKFEACESVTHLPLRLSNLSQLEELALNGCKRIRSVPRFPSSLLVFDASDCSDLEKTLDVSNLKSLKKLCLGGCRLLVDVEGIENTAQTMEELVLPGPYGSIGCSCLSHDFKNKVFKEIAFERLRRFQIWGSLTAGSVTGHQQLSFMFPNGANHIKPELVLKRLVLNKVRSPINIKFVGDDQRIIFESTLEAQRPIVKSFFRPIWIPLPRVRRFKFCYRGRLVFVVDGFVGVPCHERCAVLSCSALGGSETVEVEEVEAEDGRDHENETEAEEEANKEPEVVIDAEEKAAEDGCEEDGGRDSSGTEVEKVEQCGEPEVPKDVEEEEAEEDGGRRDGETEVDQEEGKRETEVVDEVEKAAQDGSENGRVRERQIEDEHHGGGKEIQAYGPRIIHVFQPNRVPHFLASMPCFIHWQREYYTISNDYGVAFEKGDQMQELLRTVTDHVTILVSTDASKLTTVRMAFSFSSKD